MLAVHAQILRSIQSAQAHVDPADELLRIAATVLKSANSLLPKL
jgi:hypothetical protein